MAEIGGDRTAPSRARRRCPGTTPIVAGSSSSERGEDRRDDARRVDLERQVRGLAAEHAVADLALGILHHDAPLRALHEHDERDHRPRRRSPAAMMNSADSAPVRPSSQGLRSARGQRRDDAGEDDQRDAVADAARGDLLAQPHQEQRAADQGDRRSRSGRTGRDRSPRGPADAIMALQADRDAVGLEGRQDHREVARVLVDLLAAGLALLLQRLERRRPPSSGAA